MSAERSCDLCGGCTHDGVKFRAWYRTRILRFLPDWGCDLDLSDVCEDCEKTIKELVIARRGR